jgi:molecular chaperone GrpE
MEDKEKDLPQEAPDSEDERIAGNSAEDGKASSPEEVGSELEETRSRLAYLAAEFDNYRKRAAREKEGLVSYGNERLLRAILPFLDNLERAMSQAGATGAVEGLMAGVRLTYDQLLAELRRFGLEQVSTKGTMFDPNLHEAVAQVPGEGKAEGTVISEVVKGYLLNGRLIRPAQVTVAQAPPEEEALCGADGPGDGLPERKN